MKTSEPDFLAGEFSREVLECASPLALFAAGPAVTKRQRAAAVQDAVAQFPRPAIYF
jgi:hypothetical protein